MRVAIVVPEYFPGIAVAAVMAAADRVVLADTYQYVRQSRQNRARLRSPDGGQWITIPLVGGQHGSPMRAIRIDPRSPWRRTHRKALQFNYGAAPYFEHYIQDIEKVLALPDDRLAAVAIAATTWCARRLGIPEPMIRASELDGGPSEPGAILESLGGGTLVVPEASWSVDAPRVDDAIRLRCEARPYRQQFPGFEPGCSVLDLLMLHGPATRGLITDWTELGPSQDFSRIRNSSREPAKGSGCA